MDPVKGLTVGDDVTKEVTEVLNKSGMPKVGFPVCPYCGNDPATMVTMPVNFGLVQCLTIYCANDNCRKVFAVEVMGIEQTRVQTPTRRIIGS